MLNNVMLAAVYDLIQIHFDFVSEPSAVVY